MIRMTLALVAVIYLVLLVVPGADHDAGARDGDGAAAAPGGDAGGGPGNGPGNGPGSGPGGWIRALIADAESAARTPPGAGAGAGAGPGGDREARAAASRLIETEAGPVLETADGERLAIAAVIDPVALLPRPGAEAEAAAIARLSVAGGAEAAEGAAEAEAATAEGAAEGEAGGAAEGAGGGEAIWRVGGDRVNLRAGPTTDAAILAALDRGAEVAVISEGPGEWVHLRVLSSGLEGYMARQFLEPAD